MHLRTNRLRLLQPQNLLWLSLPLLLWWMLWRVPAWEVLAILGGLNLWIALALIAANLAILALFSSRWWLILRAMGYRLPYLSLAGYRLAAFGVTYSTPGPQFGGEPLQAYLLHRRLNVPGAEATASVILDRLFELLANFAFLLVGTGTILALGLFSTQLDRRVILLPLGLLALPVVYLFALWKGRLPLSGTMNWAVRRFPGEKHEKAERFIHDAETQLARFFRASPGTILQALALSILVWGGLVFEFGLALHFLGVKMNLSQLIITLTAARIAFLMPIPAGLGTLEAGQVLAMQALGFNPAYGVSLSLLIRARDVFLGGFGLWLGGMLSR